MARELEIISAGAIGALLHGKPKPAPPAGTICPNCGTELVGHYCHVCGQSSHDSHRSILHLAWEGVEGLTHLDGRLAQTLPPLLFDPGKLARDHLEGRRARHVPPFRLFLITLLVFMFVLETSFHAATAHKTATVHGHVVSLQGGGGVENLVVATPDDMKAMMATRKAGASAKPGSGPAKAAAADVTISPAELQRQAERAKENKDEAAMAAWVTERLKRAAENREYYSIVLFTWAHRLAILLLPILAALLALAYVRRRRFFIYDHLIVAMQFLSFEFLVFAVAWIMPGPVRGWALLAATLWTPVNLFMILRGAYGSGVLAAGVKTIFLWLSTLLLFGVAMSGLMTLALAQM